MSYPCTSCGACCRLVGDVLAAPREGLAPAYRAAVEAFPYQARADGSCEQLGADGRCQVYDRRPDICNTETMSKRLGVAPVSRYRMLADVCNALQEREGLDLSYRVSLTELGTMTPSPSDDAKGDTDPKGPILPPGSHRARRAGCTCPIIDNAYGRGIDTGGGDRIFYYSGDCPVHVPTPPPAEPGE